jgi:hypothetical protein
MIPAWSPKERAVTSPFSPFLWLVEHDLRLFALALFALLAVAAEIGFRIGRARAARLKPNEKAVDGVATLTSGMLALVAFSLGLTISFAQSRYEARRLEVVEEATASAPRGSAPNWSAARRARRSPRRSSITRARASITRGRISAATNIN